MSFLPISLNLENKKILFVGGGKITVQKVIKLLDFSKDITVISKDIDKRLDSYDLNLIKKEYEKGDIKGFDIVVVTANNLELQKEIYEETREEKILYSCADILEYCDFTLSSILKKDDLSISISTNGVSPAFAKELKNYLDKIIPNSVGEFLIQMKEYRKSLPKGSLRMEFLGKKSSEYIKGWKNEK